MAIEPLETVAPEGSRCFVYLTCPTKTANRPAKLQQTASLPNCTAVVTLQCLLITQMKSLKYKFEGGKSFYSASLLKQSCASKLLSQHFWTCWQV